MPGLLSIERRDEVALVTLQRPEKRNALSIDLRVEISRGIRGAGRGRRVGCIVLTGAGSAFCAGMDVTQFGGDRENKQRLVETSTAAFDAVGSCRRPTVAAVNGPAVAGGFALALLCDLRIAAENASFGFPELPRGIPRYASARAAMGRGAGGGDHPDRARLRRRRSAAAGGRRRGRRRGASVERGARRRRRHRRRAAGGRRWRPKRRILPDRERDFGPLFAEEARLFRETLMQGPDYDAASRGGA